MELILAPVSQEDHSRLDTRRCRRLEGSEDGVLGRDWQGTVDGWEARGVGGGLPAPWLRHILRGGCLPALGRSSRAGGWSRSCSLLLDGRRPELESRSGSIISYSRLGVYTVSSMPPTGRIHPEGGWKMKAWSLSHHIMEQPIGRGVWAEKK